MKYKLWLKQFGEGCDYSIGCGETLIDLENTDIDAAISEAEQAIDDRISSDCQFEQALILTTVKVGTEFCIAAQERFKVRQQEAILEAKREKLAQLKKELGE